MSLPGLRSRQHRPAFCDVENYRCFACLRWDRSQSGHLCCRRPLPSGRLPCSLDPHPLLILAAVTEACPAKQVTHMNLTSAPRQDGSQTQIPSLGTPRRNHEPRN